MGSRLSLFWLFFCFAAHSQPVPSPISYYPEDFYAELEAGLADQPLKDTLFKILNSAHETNPDHHDRLKSSCGSDRETCYKHTPLTYIQARTVLFGQLHLEHNDQGYLVRDVYCRVTVDEKMAPQRPPGPGKIPDPKIMNCEHTWPQSKFSRQFPVDLQKSDLHILFPVLSRANSSRSNHEFGDIVTELSSPCPPSRRGYSAKGDKQMRFEVPDEQKGNSARAIFYFSVRYKEPVAEEQEASLRAWHEMDPVDENERNRQQAIFKNQFDRNPFIDHPELVGRIKDF